MLKIDIHKRFKGKQQVTEVSCKAVFEPAKTTVLFGKSGIGKTTILRMICGLEQPDNGTIIFDGVAWFDQDESMPIKKRTVGMVFQDFNLFKNMTVLQNLVYAANGMLSQQISRFAEVMGVAELYERLPSQLSKGQQQKVAILRALSVDSEVLLLDEPFSALDDDAILDLIGVINDIKSNLGTTIILVTHRKDVTLKMADSVVLLDEGVQGNPKELIKLTLI